MKKELIDDYHSLNGAWKISVDLINELTKEEMEKYEYVTELILKNEFKILLCNSVSGETIASLEKKKGIITLEADDAMFKDA